MRVKNIKNMRFNG